MDIIEAFGVFLLLASGVGVLIGLFFGWAIWNALQGIAITTDEDYQQ